MRTPKPEVKSISPIIGLRYGTSASVRLQALDLGARDVDAMELAFESAGIGGRLDRHERAADAAARRCRFDLADVDAEIGEHAAHPARAHSKLSSTGAERGDLPGLDPIERALQAGDTVSTPWFFASCVRRGGDQRSGCATPAGPRDRAAPRRSPCR